jgi:O-acetyl-ADP-ribose deacetylase (regulator of RNase III)
MNLAIKDQMIASGKHLMLIHGDITFERVDVIVNAANAQLQHGGGVAGAIASRGGPQIQIESDAWVRKHGQINHEKPAFTTAGDLPCRYVIHAVGPVWGEGDEDRKLNAAVRGALKLGAQLGLTSISFPAISTGVYGFPIERAARINLEVFQDFFNTNYDSSINIVRQTLFDQASLDVFLQVWKTIFDSPSRPG